MSWHNTIGTFSCIPAFIYIFAHLYFCYLVSVHFQLFHLNQNYLSISFFSFFSLSYSLLQKFCCHLKSLKFSLDLVFKVPTLQLCPFHYCLSHSFCDIWCMISSVCFVFNWSMFPQNFPKIFFKNMVWWNICNS